MKRLNTLFHIIKVTGFNQFLISFVSFIFISGGILLLVEPQISNYWDGLWYAFVTSTTVGYGDILATTLKRLQFPDLAILLDYPLQSEQDYHLRHHLSLILS